MHLRSWAAALDAEQAPLIAQPTGVREQVANRDSLAAKPWDLGQIFSDVVVERELAVLREQHQGRRRELFGDGTTLEDRGIRIRHSILEVRQAVAVGVEGAAIFPESDAATGRRVVEAREDSVDTCGEVGWRQLLTPRYRACAHAE